MFDKDWQAETARRQAREQKARAILSASQNPWGWEGSHLQGLRIPRSGLPEPSYRL